MRKGCLIGTGATLSAVVLASIFGVYRLVTVYYDIPSASGELPAAVAEYQKTGLPFVAAELVPTKVAPERNAADAVRAAIKAMPPKKAEKDLLDAAKFKVSPKTAGAVAPYAASLEILQSAVHRPQLNFARDWDLGPQLLFPEYASLKVLSRAAATRAALEASRGDDDAALKDLTLARQIAVWAGEEPSLIAMLVRISSESITLSGLERCLDVSVNDPRRIARYQDWLRQSPPLPKFGQALRGEAYLGISTARNLELFGGLKSFSTLDNGEMPKVDPTQLRRSGLPDETKSRAFLARHLQSWTKLYRATNGFEMPPKDLVTQMDTFVMNMEGEKGLSYVYPRILMPVFSGAGYAIVQLDARRAVQAGLAEAMTTHAQTGHWPTKVSTLDPFTKKPLLIRIKGPQIRVHSVGRDGKDNGGLFRGEPAAKGKIVDEVAVYPPLR